MQYKTAEIYFHLVFEIYQFTARFTCFVFLLCECFTVIEKQRIDSGFFLFQAELKKKQEKKKNKKIMKTKNHADSSDDEFM